MAFNLKIRAWIEPVKWLLGATVDGTYRPLADVSGRTILSDPSRLFLIQNASDGDIMVSLDSGLTMHVPILKGSSAVIDLNSNSPEPAGSNSIPKNTIFYVTRLTAANAAFNIAAFTNPTTGAIFLSSFYGR